MKKSKVIDYFITNKNINTKVKPNSKGEAFAPSNIALVKYWGKRDLELNTPNTNSLSISLQDKGATTAIEVINSDADIVYLNNNLVDYSSDFYKRIIRFLDLFRFSENYRYQIKTTTNIPVAAGVASSACGFAALVLALDNLFGWELSRQELSILARIGSGSASRSVYNGFVEWEQGEDNDLGLDSIAKQLDYTWNELRIGLIYVDKSKKKISSRDAMLSSVKTSPFYKTWPEIVSKDIQDIKQAIGDKDFYSLGQIAEQNAISMHALMQTSIPPVMYSTEDTIKNMQKVWYLREYDKVQVYFTQDAGPNLKLLFLDKDIKTIEANFPGLTIINPFNFYNYSFTKK